MSTICPTCGHENLPETMLCVRCYSLIQQPGNAPPVTARSTGSLAPLRAPTSPLVTRPDEDQPGVKELDEDHRVVIRVAGPFAPLAVIIDSQAVLGRYTPNSPTQQIIDLTPYQALEKGVSRTHLVLRRSNAGLIAEDLASSNGTWINGLRIPAYSPVVLRSGQHVRLGRLEMSIDFIENEMSE
jgi:hypothetical protein